MALRRAPDVVDDEVDGRAVLIDADGRELITLNPTGTLVWRSMDGARDIAELAAIVHDAIEGEVSREQVEHDVQRFLELLSDEGLVVER